MSFGDTLRELRIKSGMTQLQLADKVNVTKSVISYYEHKDKKPSPDVLIKFSEIFGVTTDYLLGIEKVPEAVLDVSGLTEDDIKAVQVIIDYSGSVVKTQIQSFYNELIYVVEEGEGCSPPMLHNQSTVPDSSRMQGSGC